LALFSWEQRKLGEIGSIVTGTTPSTAVPEYYSEDGIPWVTPTDITENVTFDTERKLSSMGQQVGRIVPANTILVTCIASIGKNTMLGIPGSFNQQINGLTPDKNKYEPYFLLTESALWSAQMKKSAAAGTMQIVNRTEFSEMKTWLPKREEQKAIGNFFHSLDNLITLHQREHGACKREIHTGFHSSKLGGNDLLSKSITPQAPKYQFDTLEEHRDWFRE
jgi:type I restriction enzyme S subunit